MTCKQAKRLIDRSLDGLATAPEKALLEGHLSTCQACSAESAAVERLNGLLAESLPLQAALGAGFAAQVAERLTSAETRRSILKEALVMSRLKYAVLVGVMLAVVVGCLLAPHSGDSQALAAVQSVMARVKSLHFRADLPGPKPADWCAPEVWARRDASKETTETGWRITKGGVQYLYLSRFKVMFILSSAEDTAKMFGELADPRAIVSLTKEPGIHASVAVQDLQRNGKPMRRIEVQLSGTGRPTKKTDERSDRVLRKMNEVIEERLREEGTKHRLVTEVAGRGGIRSKQTYLVDPSTNLVQSMEIFAPDRENGGWRCVGRVASIDYNIDLPDRFFSTETPPGTKVYDFRAANPPPKQEER